MFEDRLTGFQSTIECSGFVGKEDPWWNGFVDETVSHKLCFPLTIEVKKNSHFVFCCFFSTLACFISLAEAGA